MCNAFLLCSCIFIWIARIEAGSCERSRTKNALCGQHGLRSLAAFLWTKRYASRPAVRVPLAKSIRHQRPATLGKIRRSCTAMIADSGSLLEKEVQKNYRILTRDEARHLVALSQKGAAVERSYNHEELQGARDDYKETEVEKAREASVDRQLRLVERASKIKADILTGRAASEALVNHNIRLVMKFAKRYRQTGVNYDDLVQEGTIGLYEAIESFDLSRGTAFTTHASWRIRQKISAYVSKHSRTIKIPVYMHYLAINLAKARSGSEYSDDEQIANAMGISVEKLRRVKEIDKISKPVSLSTPFGKTKDGGHIGTLEDVIPSNYDPLKIMEKQTIIDKVHDILDAELTMSEANVLRMRFGMGLEDGSSMKQIAKLLEIPYEKVARTNIRAIMKLRRHLERNPETALLLKGIVDYD